MQTKEKNLIELEGIYFINSRQNEPLIRKLSQASRVKTIQQMLKKDPLYVDLHGFRE